MIELSALDYYVIVGTLVSIMLARVDHVTPGVQKYQELLFGWAAPPLVYVGNYGDGWPTPALPSPCIRVEMSTSPTPPIRRTSRSSAPSSKLSMVAAMTTLLSPNKFRRVGVGVFDFSGRPQHRFRIRHCPWTRLLRLLLTSQAKPAPWTSPWPIPSSPLMGPTAMPSSPR